jgi:hypothetical protein
MPTEELPAEELPADAEESQSQPAPVAAVDLTTEIAQSLSRQPGDRVRVSHVWGDHYRCNWLAPVNRLDGSATPAMRIRYSRFLKVTRDEAGKLAIKDMTAEN